MQIAHAVSSVGLEDSSNLLSRSSTKVDVQIVKELSYLLYSISEKHGWMESAILFNGLGTSWSSLQISNSGLFSGKQEQMSFDFEADSREEES